MVEHESEIGKKINELAEEMKKHCEELSPEDEEYVKRLKVVNAGDIKEPWRYRKWSDRMREIRRENLRRGYVLRRRTAHSTMTKEQTYSSRMETHHEIVICEKEHPLAIIQKSEENIKPKYDFDIDPVHRMTVSDERRKGPFYIEPSHTMKIGKF